MDLNQSDLRFVPVGLDCGRSGLRLASGFVTAKEATTSQIAR